MFQIERVEKGNTPLTAHKTDMPIEQEYIDSKIWGLIQSESGLEDLGVDNKLEFLIILDHNTKKYSANFIKITKEDGRIVEFRASKELCDAIINQGMEIKEGGQN